MLSLFLAFKLTGLLKLLVKKHNVQQDSAIKLQHLDQHLLHFFKKVGKAFEVIVVYLRSLINDSFSKDIKRSKNMFGVVSVFLLNLNFPIVKNTVES
jgi:hypothetical protein